jgi:hypothetical protein
MDAIVINASVSFPPTLALVYPLAYPIVPTPTVATREPHTG